MSRHVPLNCEPSGMSSQANGLNPLLVNLEGE